MPVVSYTWLDTSALIKNIKPQSLSSAIICKITQFVFSTYKETFLISEQMLVYVWKFYTAMQYLTLQGIQDNLSTAGTALNKVRTLVNLINFYFSYVRHIGFLWISVELVNIIPKICHMAMLFSLFFTSSSLVYFSQLEFCLCTGTF